MEKQRNSLTREILHRFFKDRPAMIGLCILTAIILFAVIGSILIPAGKALETNGVMRLSPPSRLHPFGTDNIGRDVLARVIHGTKYSLSIGIFATLFSAVLGCVIGAACGYFGGWFDNAVMRFMDILNCIPSLVLMMAIIVTLGAGMKNLLLAMSIALVPGFVRLVRSTVLSITNVEYVDAAIIYGSSSLRIIIKHILPNAMGPIIITAAQGVAAAIICAASMSYLGFGVQPPLPEWGVMLSDAKDSMRQAPWSMLFPGMMIMLSALSINLIGDGLRDALDPRLKD